MSESLPVRKVAGANAGKRSRYSRWWLKPILPVATLALLLPLMEIAVRLVVPRPPSWLPIFRHHPFLPTYACQVNVHATVDTGDSRWTVNTDDEGFRVGQQPGVPDERPVLLWLGDSFTFGYGVDYESSFVGLLALAKEGRYRPVNAAVGGYGPTQYRQTLEYLLDKNLRPRLVLIGAFIGNDFLDVIDDKNPPIRDGILGNEWGAKSLLKQHFHLYRLATATIHRLHPYGVRQHSLDLNSEVRAWTNGELREADSIFRREFERMAALCQSHGVEMAVLIIPAGTMVDALAKGASRSPDGARDQSLPLRHAVSAFRDLHIRYLDLTPMLVAHPVTETYFYFDGHFTARGHALVRDAVVSEWRDLLLGP
jgi:GDSL-like Lipase/Acylhydrolase family